jgi:NitT/TauT family transport system ATP-binding protein
MKPLVEIKNVSKTYHTATEETVAIEGFSLDIYKGDFIAIVGPSGCGKSTLLSIIAGLTPPTSGECVFNADEDLAMGYMLQKDHLLPWRTILRNATLGLEVQNNISGESVQYVKNLLRTYGLGDFMNAFPYQLSGGMRQRVALIRTLALKPQILLLDEPFSALDYQTRLAVSDDIGRIIYSENKTALLVTHDISEAISLADSVVVMSKRPSVIKSIYEINLTPDTPSCIERRKAKEFAYYYDKIWKDLDIHV